MKRMFLLCAILVFLTLPLFVASGSDYASRFQKLERFVQKNRVGQNGDYWLVKETFLGSDPVALIFGFPDNHGFCQELADAQNKMHPAARVSCVRAQDV